jgi:tRNA pseudouridine32 synthase/23S rRNA pseudouridine746 synthase
MHFQSPIIFTHPDLLVAYKPAGVSFHSEDGEAGFAAQVQALTAERLYPVHRLDRITSGLVMFARNAQAARELGQHFENGEIAKFYVALSDRKPAKKQGWIKGRMEKGRNGAWKLGREQGLLAVTQFFSFGQDGSPRLFVVSPRTGRTHQIRVALKSLGSPILGDARYGGSLADRAYLHAWAMRLEWRGETLCVIAPPIEGAHFADPAVRARLEEIKAPWLLDWPQWPKTKQPTDND